MKQLSLTVLLLSILQLHFYGQDANSNAVPTIVPPTPEAYAIGKFGGNQIGLTTGSAIYTMPLYSFKIGNLSLPLSMSYSSNGVKVDEVSSRCGMQWKMDFAGVVNRTIMGDPDEQPSWRATTNDTSSWLFYGFLSEVAFAQGNGAFQPDQFNYSVPGYAGKFIVDTGGRIIQIPYNNVKITKYQFGSFQVTTPDGTVYKFGNGITESILNTPAGGDNGTCYPENLGQPAVTAWYLYGIYLPDGDSIKYVYDLSGLDSAAVKCVTGTNQTYTFQGGLFPTDISIHTADNINTCYSMSEYSRVVLSEIRTSVGKVKLYYSSREDVIGERKMDSLVVTNNSGQVIKKWRFNYTYSNFTGTGFDSPLTGYPSVQYQFPEVRKRLFLTGIDDFTGSPAESYHFSYNSIDSLPPRLSYAQDYWGYFNGISNSYLFPAYTYGGLYSPSGVEFGADRRGNFAASAKGVLTRITYPTGGFTDYTYQPAAVTGYLKYKPAFDTLHFSGSLTPVNNLYISDTFALRSGSMKVSFSSTAPAWTGNPETELVPDTTIHITIKNVNNFDEVLFDYNGSVWSSFSLPVVHVPDNASCIVTVQSVYPPYANWSVTLYNRHDTTPTTLPMGGVMVKSIQDNDGAGHIQNRKLFTYSFQGDSAPYNYSDDEGMFYSWKRQLDNNNPQRQIGLTQITSNTNYPLYINDLGAIPYPLVTEQWTDSTDKVYGGIEHEFLLKRRTLPIYFGHEDEPSSGFTEYTRNIVPGAPSSNDDLHNGLELFNNVFKMVDTVKHYTSKTKNIYSVDTNKATVFTDTLYAVKLALNRAEKLDSVQYLWDWDVNRYFVFSNWMHLDSTLVTSYTDDGDSLKTMMAYQYGNYRHMQPTVIAGIDSKGDTIKTFKKYPHDYDGTAPYTQMIARNIITEVVDVVQKNTTLNREISHTKTNFAFYQLDSVIKPATVQTAKAGGTLHTDVSFNRYDTLGNLQQYTAKDGIINSFIWDYRRKYPVAKIVHADTAAIAFTSFEADGNGNWTVTSPLRDSSDALTGRACYDLDNGSIYDNKLPDHRPFIISYWLKNGTCTVTGEYIDGDMGSGIMAFMTPGRTVNGWTYYVGGVTRATHIAIAGTGLIDDLRVYPPGAQMTSYTYDPLVGATSVSDPNGEVLYYEYDSFHRLKFIKDYKGNIIKNIQYNIHNSLSQ